MFVSIVIILSKAAVNLQGECSVFAALHLSYITLTLPHLIVLSVKCKETCTVRKTLENNFEGLCKTSVVTQHYNSRQKWWWRDSRELERGGM